MGSSGSYRQEAFLKKKIKFSDIFPYDIPIRKAYKFRPYTF
jgi:hypothetical protein